MDDMIRTYNVDVGQYNVNTGRCLRIWPVKDVCATSRAEAEDTAVAEAAGRARGDAMIHNARARQYGRATVDPSRDEFRVKEVRRIDG